MRRVFSVFLKIISHFTFFSFIFFIFIFTPGFLSSSYKFVSFSNLNFPSFLDSNSNLNSDSNSNSDLNSITLSEISDRIDIPSNFSNDKIKLNRPLFSVGEFQAGKEKELDEKSIVAESALVMDYKTGDILWEKNSTKKMFPASLTKIMTSIVAIENAKDLNELVRISKNASGKNHSSFGFRVGDRISVLDLIKAALICSHNNATIALAEHISGSEEEFVKLMNLKAKEIGATHTLFQNTNGLDFESFYHKTTAQDLALITSYCLRNEIFRRIVSTSKDYISINGKEIEINNTNDLLSYEYIKGVKTGYTENAGFCLILYSEKNDIELIVVILNSSQEGRDEDGLKLLNWVYDNFEYQKILDSTKSVGTFEIGRTSTVDIDLYPASDYQRLVNRNSDIINFEYEIKTNTELPVVKNQVLGKIKVYVNGVDKKEEDLVSREDIEKPYIYQEISSQKDIQSRRMLIFLLAFYFFIFTFIIVRNLRRRRYYY